ncbi:MAG TPA: hypothetical protein PKL77_06075 [Candidatus Omnitrophota bacterium]|nr:hypothetical protein [Candidatus Omnitrophota bacterium]
MEKETKSAILKYLSENISDRKAIDKIQEEYDISLFDLMEEIGRSKEFRRFDAEHPGRQGVAYAKPGKGNASWRRKE